MLALATALPASAPAGEPADVGVAAAGTVPIWRTTAAVGPGVHAATVRLPAGGRLRTAIVLTPRTARPVPLLLVLHGRDTTPAHELVRSGFADLAAHGDARAGVPGGVGRSWNARTGCSRDGGSSTSTTSGSSRADPRR